MTIKQVAVTVLNVRSAPNTTSPIVAQLHHGQTVDIGDATNGWAQVKAPSGWVSVAFLADADNSDIGTGVKDLSITYQKIKLLAPGAKDEVIGSMATSMAATLTSYSINTELRIDHFFAQAAEESDGFRTLFEYGNQSYFARYDGRADLGNTHPGDGFKYRGRGIFQLTGRTNYELYGGLVGLDFINNPDLAAVPANAVKTACLYWTRKGLNQFADNDDIVSITRRINGGTNGLDTRKTYLARAKNIW